jgi:hypothetical protein
MLFQIFFNSTIYLLVFYKNIKLLVEICVNNFKPFFHNNYDIWIHEFCIEAPTLILRKHATITRVDQYQ